jgi:hypothetical protein
MNRAMFASVEIVPVRSLLDGFSKSNKIGKLIALAELFSNCIENDFSFRASSRFIESGLPIFTFQFRNAKEQPSWLMLHSPSLC